MLSVSEEKPKKRAKGAAKAAPKAAKPAAKKKEVKAKAPKKEPKAKVNKEVKAAEEKTWLDDVPPPGEPITKQAAPAAVEGFDEFKSMALPGEAQLGTISQAVEKWRENNEKVIGLQTLLDEINREQIHITTKLIPDAMAAANVQKFKSADGHEVEIKEFLNGSLPKDPFGRKQALDWVIENEGGDLIKSKVTVEFGKGDQKQVDNVTKFLRANGYAFDAKEDIHSQTYCAFIREAMAGGKKVPLEELNCYAGRSAKIKPPKAKIPKFGT